MEKWLGKVRSSIGGSRRLFGRTLSQINLPVQQGNPEAYQAQLNKRELQSRGRFSGIFQNLIKKAPLNALEALIMESAFVDQAMVNQATYRRSRIQDPEVIKHQSRLSDMQIRNRRYLKEVAGKRAILSVGLSEEQGEVWIERMISGGERIAKELQSQDWERDDQNVLNQIEFVLFYRPTNFEDYQAGFADYAQTLRAQITHRP